jgi:hypothetical protein
MVDDSININEFDYSSIYRAKEFTEAMNTYFDTGDEQTRCVLLAVNEADQASVMTSLSSKLYSYIVDKVDDIDFGTIPRSKGDITKIGNYEQLRDCINIMVEVMHNYKQPTTSIETVQIALQNMIDRKDLFTKAFKMNVELPMIMYNTLALSIVSSVSYLISSCIEFIKLPDDSGYEIALNKVAVAKSKEHVLFKDLESFNKCCEKGDFDKAMNYVIIQSSSKRLMKEAGPIAMAAGAAIVVIAALIMIIHIIRELIYYFYYSRVKLSDYFTAQSALLTMNAYNIENNLARDDKSRKSIATKQRKYADMFTKISNKLQVADKVASVKTANDMKAASKEKYNIKDVVDTIPDSANSTLF